MGGFNEHKGVFVLLEAFQKVIKECSGAKLVIAGNGGNERRVLKQVKKLGLEGCVDFVGQIDNKGKTFRGFRMLVLPSVCLEQFGLVGLEACSFGVPVIGSKVGGVKDWLKNDFNGFLVPVGDSGLLAKRIVKLLKDDVLWKRFSSNAVRVANSFNKNKHYYSLLKVYKRVLKS